ncbi:MAG: twitching motility protein PilI [Flavobacteriales bacterium]
MAVGPFQALANLAAQSRKSAKGLPQKIEAVPRWRGLGFVSFGLKFVAPMGQITEMMEMPGYTRLPGVQPWVVGLSNVRGRLLPLFDLAMYMGGQISQHKKSHRVFVLETEELYSGLMVDRAMGMQHFETSKFTKQIESSVPDGLKSYITGAYRDSNDDAWHVFDFLRLAADSRFVNASLL